MFPKVPQSSRPESLGFFPVTPPLGHPLKNPRKQSHMKKKGAGFEKESRSFYSEGGVPNGQRSSLLYYLDILYYSIIVVAFINSKIQQFQVPLSPTAGSPLVETWIYGWLVSIETILNFQPPQTKFLTDSPMVNLLYRFHSGFCVATYLLYMGVSKNRGTPKMDGLLCNGKPYEQTDDLGEFTTPIFGSTPIYFSKYFSHAEYSK